VCCAPGHTLRGLSQQNYHLFHSGRTSGLYFRALLGLEARTQGRPRDSLVLCRLLLVAASATIQLFEPTLNFYLTRPITTFHIKAPACGGVCLSRNIPGCRLGRIKKNIQQPHWSESRLLFQLILIPPCKNLIHTSSPIPCQMERLKAPSSRCCQEIGTHDNHSILLDR